MTVSSRSRWTLWDKDPFMMQMAHSTKKWGQVPSIYAVLSQLTLKMADQASSFLVVLSDFENSSSLWFFFLFLPPPPPAAESAVPICTVGFCKIQFRYHNTGHEFKSFVSLGPVEWTPQATGTGPRALLFPEEFFLLQHLNKGYTHCQVQSLIKVFSEECRKSGETLLKMVFCSASM